MGRLTEVVGTNILRVGEEEIRLGHTYYEVDTLMTLIRLFRPEWFVEVGVHEGGLSYLLLSEFPNLHYLGIEWDPGIVRPVVKALYQGRGQTLLYADCFDEAVLKKVRSLENKYIYCDGGHKAQELVAYKETCFLGDCIFVHDYWDGLRAVRDCPDEHISVEVKPEDVAHMNTVDWWGFPERLLKETRILGWSKFA